MNRRFREIHPQAEDLLLANFIRIRSPRRELNAPLERLPGIDRDSRERWKSRGGQNKTSQCQAPTDPFHGPNLPAQLPPGNGEEWVLGRAQGGSKVRPVEGRSCSAALKSEDRRRKAGQIRIPKADGRKKAETRRQKADDRTALGLGFRSSDFGLRPSFGPRPSGFGFQSRRPAVFGSRVWNGPDRL